MIKIAYCNVEDLNLSETCSRLPEARKAKVNNFRFDKDKKLSAGAYFLLNKLLEEEQISKAVFKVGKYGKPYISNHKNLFFNMSHSGKFVACAISDKEVGLDIELTDPTIELEIAENFFYNSEYENIMKSKNPQNEFFRYWVLKESYMKYTGLGFNLELDSFEIDIGDEIKLKNDKNNLKFSLFDINDYKLGICSQYAVENIAEYTVDDII